jgi:hypothetical protein
MSVERLADWRRLPPRERTEWLESLWHDALRLRARYRLALRSGWWEDAVQVEALAALAAWVERYDSGDWDDPPGKLALLCDLERVEALLRDGGEPFEPRRDRARFLEHLRRLADGEPEAAAGTGHPARSRSAPRWGAEMEDDG